MRVKILDTYVYGTFVITVDWPDNFHTFGQIQKRDWERHIKKHIERCLENVSPDLPEIKKNRKNIGVLKGSGS